MRLIICILLSLSCISVTIAQDMAPDTILSLDDVTILSSRINRFAVGQKVLTLDSLTRSEFPAGTLAELVTGSTSAYIRNYGQGTLSTLSFRGTSANHTGLLWNGIRLAPPNIGYLDLSLVQDSYFNDISVLYGGASPMFGSGSIGGGIHLENHPVFEKSGFDAGIGISGGSFGMMAVEAKGSIYRQKFYSRTAFTLVNATNDFPYTSLNGETEKLSNAAIFKSGFIQDVAFQLTDKQYIMASTWFQYADREIPPTMTEDISGACQMDRSWRTMVLWKDYHENNILEAKLAYFNEFTRYSDPYSSIYSTIQSQSMVGSFETTWEIGKNSAVLAGSQFTYEYADLDYYEHPQSQENLAVFASYRLNFPSIKWQASLNGRQEFLTDYQSPFLFSAGLEGKIWRFISARLNASRNFRAPTLNERFWQPGGNPGLNPEESWNEEAGISIEYESSSSLIKFSVTAFNSNVDNWILWLPMDGSNLWSVVNAQEVWSRGIEISGNQSLTPGLVSFFFAESYSYTKSTNEKKLFDLDASYKKQLIYTPLHRFVIKSGAIFHGFTLSLNGNFTSEVYSTKDNVGSIPPYFLMDAIVSKSFKIKHQTPFIIQFNMNNILNSDYQAIPYRPMPGFNFMLTLKAELKKFKVQSSKFKV
jgi:vitamin B12 transporter